MIKYFHNQGVKCRKMLKKPQKSTRTHTISVLLSILLSCNVANVRADDTGMALADLYSVYETTSQFCDGISDRISAVSGVSKINTGITATGTVAAGGALYAGIKKSETDQEIAELAKQLCADGGCDPDKVEAMSDQEFFDKILPTLVEMISRSESNAAEKMAQKSELDAMVAKSKRLGNWRTGLLAGTVGTNIASAIISGLNKNQSDLIQQISACNAAVARLREYYNAALQNGVNPIENPVMQTFQTTITNCGTLQTSDVEKIEKRMTAVFGTSIAGATIGVVGTGTSIAANTDKIRNDNSDAGKQTEKTLNTISNVAAGTNIATGIVGTGLNISLITLTRDLMRTAQNCEDTL